MSKNLRKYLLVGHVNSIHYIAKLHVPHTLDIRISWPKAMNEHDVIYPKKKMRVAIFSVMARITRNMDSLFI